MENIINYAKTQLKTFEEEPLNRVDSLILSWMSYLRIPVQEKNARALRGVPLKTLYKAEYFDELFHNVYSEEQARQLFFTLCASPRFRNIKILKYTQQLSESQEKQFSAMTLQINNNSYFISFRGTDSTIIGWKEDFNMIFEYPVPSQLAAEKYTKQIMKYTIGDIYLGGHSKGGNLAVYAGAQCDNERIKAIYTHDGPGFLPEILDQENFKNIVHKITKIVPQSSIFGMILEANANAIIIQSSRKSLWQHDPFSWEIKDKDFVYADELNIDSKYFNTAFQNWMKGITSQQREQFIDLWYEVIQSTNSQTTSELQENWLDLIKAISDIDEETRDFILKITKTIISIGIKTVPKMMLTQKSEAD